MALTNPTAQDAKLADSTDNPQIAESQAVVAELTDSTGGTANDTVQDVTASFNQTILNDNFADLNAKINGVLQILAAHGLMDDA
jgi:hypothetical protein